MKNVVRWKVTVEAVIGETKVVQGEWCHVAQEPTGQEDSSKRPIMKPVYGYAPARERYVEEKRQVFEQTVETPIDMVKLVQVINNVN